MTDLRRAWATLGLRPGATLETVHAAYRNLANRYAERGLTPEEIDRFVASMGSESPVQELLDSLSSYRNAKWISTFDSSEDQWALSPLVASGLVVCLGALVIGAFEWAGHPLPREAGTGIGFLMAIAATVAGVIAAARQGS